MVSQVNGSSSGIRVVLGAIGVHNSATFPKEVDDAMGTWPESSPLNAAERLRKKTVKTVTLV